MRNDYDFTDARPNPYAARMKRPVTIRIDVATIGYFKDLGARACVPYQTLINLYLRDCVVEKRKLAFVAGEDGATRARKARATKATSARRRPAGRPGSKRNKL